MTKYIFQISLFLIGVVFLGLFIFALNESALSDDVIPLGCISALFFVFALIGFFSKKANLKKEELRNEKENAERLERERARREWLNKRKEDFFAKCKELENSYGPISKSVAIDSDYDFDNQIFFFESSNMVLIKGKEIPMADVISAELNNNSTVIKGTTTYETVTDTSDMLGRAGLGYLLDGKVGEHIGATTAARKTIVKTTPDRIKNHYIVAITVNSISNPIIEIDMGSYKKKLAEELYAVFSVIVNRNMNRETVK